MEQIMRILGLIVEHGPAIISALVSVLSALVALFMLIPGEQPEKALQGIVDFVAKFSRKKVE